jgi:hypothetical protein
MEKEAAVTNEDVYKFIAGFFDGDGSVTIQKPSQKDKTPNPRVAFYQSNASGIPPELAYIKSFLGGALHREDPRGDNRRQSWKLCFSSFSESKYVLELLQPYVILKRDQVAKALEYLDCSKENPQHHYEYMRDRKRDYQNVEIDTLRICNAYLAGLFAADGSVGIYRAKHGYCAVYVQIVKKGCVQLLHAIRDKMGYGSVSQGRWALSGGQTVNFIEGIDRYLVGQKKAQTDMVVRFQKTRGSQSKKRTVEELAEMDKIMNDLKRMKKT